MRDRHSIPGDPAVAVAAKPPADLPVSEAKPLPVGRHDMPDQTRGWKALSAAFVMIGADGQLTVTLRDGRVLLLRDVVMRPKDFCGTLLSGGKGGARFCAGYADVAAARAGNAPGS